MNWEAWVTVATVAAVLYGLVKRPSAPDVVLFGCFAFLTTMSLFSDRFPTPRQAAAVFGNEGLLTIAVLFPVAAGLTETGGLSLITERLLGRPKSVAGAQLRLMLPVTAISAVLNNTPVVAMFMPVVSDWCKRTRISPSKLFIPLSFAAVLGGSCTLIGTSTNLVVQGLLIEAARSDPAIRPMSMFTISWIGVPAAILGLAYILLVSRKLLPERNSAGVEMGNPRQYTVEMVVRPKSAIDGQTIEEAGLRHLPDAYLMEVQRDGETLVAVGPEQRLRGGDRLIFVGLVQSVVDLQKTRGLEPATDQVFKLEDPRPSRCLVEAVVSPSCPIVGKTIREGRFRTRYHAAVIAAHRAGHRIEGKIGDIELRAGDTLLIETHPRFLDNHRNRSDFYLVSKVAGSQPRRHEKAGIAMAILAGMVVLMGLESLPLPSWMPGIAILVVAMLAAGLMLLSRCISVEIARRSVEWPLLVSVGAALGIGKAMETTGAAGAMAELMNQVSRPFGPWGVLLGVYALTLVFTEVVTNNAAAALAFPIARAAAASLGVSFMPFAVAIAMAASAGFATPIGYQTHLMVYGPGGYRFGDYVRIGVPLDLLVMAVAVGLTPLVFPF